MPYTRLTALIYEYQQKRSRPWQELARAIGIEDEEQVRILESGQVKLPLYLLEKLIHELDIPADEVTKAMIEKK
jgi:hypothetical protein